MAINNLAHYHFSIDYVSRGRGEFVIDKAAYITGEKIYDKYYGRLHNHMNKTDVLNYEILLPEYAPFRFRDLATLVNEMEQVEKRKDSRTARLAYISLFNNKDIDKEQAFTLEERIVLVRDFVNEAFVNRGMCAIVGVHEVKNKDNPAKDNPHAHVMLTTRSVDEYGFKNKNREWDKTSNLIFWRELWAKAQNKEFERKNLQIRVSAKNYLMLGIYRENREPLKHRSRAVIELEKKGIETDISNMNRDIMERNLKSKEQKRQRERERDRDR